MKDLNRQTYNKIAEDWHKDHVNDTWWIAGTEKFSSYLEAGDKILDIGCGSGIKSDFFTKKGFNVLGVDLSENMVDIARKNYPKSRFEVGDIENLGKFPQKFNGVFAQAVLLHVAKSKVSEVLRSFKDALLPQGYLYIAVKQLRPGGSQEEVVTENDYGYDYQRFFTYFTVPEIKQLIVDAGFDIIFEETSTATNKTDWIQFIGKTNG